MTPPVDDDATGRAAPVDASRGAMGARATACALALALLLANVSSARSSAHAYARASFYATNDAAIVNAGREGMFASANANDGTTDDARAGRWIGARARVSDGRAYVRLDGVTFERSARVARAGGAGQGSTGLVEIVTFERGDAGAIGVVDEVSGRRRFCCDAKMKSDGACGSSDVGRVIVREDVGEDGTSTGPRRAEVWFDGDDVTARSDVEAVRVRKTGMYHVWFVICDPDHAGVTVSGRTMWKNPNGYLPGAKTALLPFYGFATMAYLGLGFAWTLAHVGHWRHVLALHNCITAVLALSMTESAVWYFDYANFNATGYRPYVFTMVAVLLGSLRATLSRALVLTVSMGYGVVRPTLGGMSAKVISLGICYLCSAAVKDVVEHVGSVDDLRPGARLFLVLPISVFETVFLLWIFSSLSRTLTQLALRRQTQKLALYRAFTNALALSVALSVVWLAYEMWFKSTDMIDEKWESVWMLSAFWNVLSFGLLAVMCFLWKPSGASSQYAYSELTNGDITEDSWWSELVAPADGGEFANGKSPHKGAKSSRVMNSAKKSRAMRDFSLDDDDDDSTRDLEMEMGKIE